MRHKVPGLLVDIRDAARYIAEDTAGHSFESFRADRRVRQVVERNFEIIGEALRRLSRDDPVLAGRITAYQRVIGLRNALIHGYDVINYPTVWHTIQESLPLLRAEVDLLLREAEAETEGDDPS